MSVDYWVQAFNNGEGGVFPLSVVEEAFSQAITDKSISHHESKIHVTFTLKYPQRDHEDDLTLLITDDELQLTGGFSFVHAPQTDAFWQSVVDVLQATHTALFWADTENALVIGQAETQSHLPPDMIEALGKPRLVSSFEDIFIRNNPWH